MAPLNPTLWRTCRVLAGPTRLQLLRRILAAPGATVTRAAEAAGISLSRASQELRRLQSRGLLGVERAGPFVRYFPKPDPQVPGAAPLLHALKATFARGGAARDAEAIRIATALAHPRRILLFRRLLEGPATLATLRSSSGIPFDSVHHHLQLLRRGHLVVGRPPVCRAARRNHPLAKCLVELVRNAP